MWPSGVVDVSALWARFLLWLNVTTVNAGSNSAKNPFGSMDHDVVDLGQSYLRRQGIGALHAVFSALPDVRHSIVFAPITKSLPDQSLTHRYMGNRTINASNT